MHVRVHACVWGGGEGGGGCVFVHAFCVPAPLHCRGLCAHPYTLITRPVTPRPPCPQVTGRPIEADVAAIDSPFAATMMESCTVSQARRIQDMFPNASDEAADLLRWAGLFGGGAGGAAGLR